MHEEDPAPTPRPAPALRERLLETGRFLLERGLLPLALVLAPLLYQRQVAKEAEQAREKASRSAEQARIDADRAAQREQSYRLYTEMINRREEADTALRRELFIRLMGGYRDPQTIEQRLVSLEMLSLNFHDTLHLSPLFAEVDGLIAQEPRPRRNHLLAELDRIVSQVKGRQAATLEIDGAKREWAIQLTDLYEGSPALSERFSLARPGSPPNATGPAARREFVVDVLSHDPLRRRLYVVVSSPDGGVDRPLGFWVDPFDLPLLSFGRLSATERFALLLDHYDPNVGFAVLRLIYFPSTRSAAKDRPYIDDLINRLLPASVDASRQLAAEPPAAGPAAATAAAAGSAPASAASR